MPEKAFSVCIKDSVFIDPPYNTGHDFVYNDSFDMSTEVYSEVSGEFDEENNRLVQNTDSNGRFHTDWLNMLYSRLKVSKNLLSDDGVIFISIDDNERDNLRKICDEVFGEDNFINVFIWNTEGHTDNQFLIKVNHEYIVCYSKNKSLVEMGWVIDPNTREESNLWKGYAENSITKNGEKNPVSYITLPKGFPCKSEQLCLKSNSPVQAFWDEVDKNKFISRNLTDEYNIQYPIRMNDMIVSDYKLQDEVTVFSGWANANKLNQFIKNGFEPLNEIDGRISFFLSDKGVIYYHKERTKARNILSVLNSFGTTEQMRYYLEKEGLEFSYPKPVDLINYLIKVGSNDDNIIVMDFFSGSATTAHATMQLNAEDGGNRKFIMVQLPEETDEKSEAYKAGYKNICEIGKERIRRAGAKIKEENPLTTADLDTGFRVLKLDSSNMKDVYYNPADLDFASLDDLVSNIKEDRTPEDLLFQVMLELGVLPSSKIEETEIAGKKVFDVAENFLIACFDENITEEVITEIAKKKPYYFVMRDNSMASDSVATNFEQIFATYSPETVRKVL